MSDYSCTQYVSEHPPKWLQRCLVVAWLVPRETAAVSVQVLCTSLHCDVIRSRIRRMHVRLAATCHPHYWQNDRDLLRAAAVTREWNGQRNKSQHKKLTMEKENYSAAPAGTRTRDLSMTSLSLYQ